MRVYVINLARSEVRRAAMAAQLGAMELPHAFFRAIDGATDDVAPFRHRIRRDRQRLIPLTPGEVGCFASHFLLWMECVRVNEAIAILEDDLDLGERVPAVLSMCDGLLARGHRMIRLNGFRPRPVVRVSDLPGGHALIRYPTGPRGAQAYTLSPDGARRLLKHAAVWAEGVDFYLDRFGRHGVASYAITPFCISPADTPSDIGVREAGFQQSMRWQALKIIDSAARRAANFRFRAGEILEKVKRTPES